MFFIFARAPPPDAPYWPGRRWLAAVDALAWPALWVVVIACIPAHSGVAGSVAVAWAGFSSLARLRRALHNNRRYRFTTWRWGRPAMALLLFSWVLKLILAA